MTTDFVITGIPFSISIFQKVRCSFDRFCIPFAVAATTTYLFSSFPSLALLFDCSLVCVTFTLKELTANFFVTI